MRILWVLLGSCAFGCQASAGTQASINTQGEAQADSQGGLNSTNTSSGLPGPTENAFDQSRTDSTDPTTTSSPALLGARAGLRLADASNAQCQCLAVAVGQPRDPAFHWDGEPSMIDRDSQLVFALGSEGVHCATPEANSLGASYQGYETSGLDVIVQVESGRLGRPLAGGAIIPKPGAGGRIIVRKGQGAGPYGGSADGKNRDCVVWTAP